MDEATRETHATQGRYDRLAPLYDPMEVLIELSLYRPWRASVWERVRGERILEVGTGTGKNMNHYPSGAEIHAVDISPRMLERAAKRADQRGFKVRIYRMDVQRMSFEDDSFDTAVATFVFCSVPDAMLGLRELRRVVKPGGQVHLLEHMRSQLGWLGQVMDLLDPITLRLLGPHINRRTVENVQKAGLEISSVEHLDSLGVFRRIVARIPAAAR
jgi:ubiquinone/menaquinone biosynthesis C-methylase UbiE